MALLIYAGQRDINAWINALKETDDTLDIRVYPDYGDVEEIDFALTWPYPEGLWNQFPNLKAISSIGAGVSHILGDETLDKQVPILKLIDDNLNQSMWEYLLAVIAYHAKRLHLYKALESGKEWKELEVRGFSDTTVGIMGLGSIGSYVAERLVSLGFAVKGFANSPKNIAGVEVSTLKSADDALMQSIDIWVSILPLTAQTEGIFDKSFFVKVKKGAVFVNVGRGPQVIEDDLVEALASGVLSSAYLDVFVTEPLPAESVLWHHPKVHVTPHIASITDPSSVAVQIVENYQRALEGRVLNNVVDRTSGY